MQITLNGDRTEVAEVSTVASLLIQLSIGRDRVAVERNGDIVPKATYEQQALAENDTIEIVHFVGGGQTI